jgi:hypothetical protein
VGVKNMPKIKTLGVKLWGQVGSIINILLQRVKNKKSLLFQLKE